MRYVVPLQYQFKSQERTASVLKQIVKATTMAAIMWPICITSSVTSQDFVEWDGIAHSQGNIQLSIQPGGWGWLAEDEGGWIPLVDPFTHDIIYGCVYPSGSRHMYLDGRFIAGGIADHDTVFSFGVYEEDSLFHKGSWWRATTLDASKPHYSPEARSLLDLECVFYDTAAVNYGMSHIWDFNHQYPLEIKVEQRSMAWSGVLVDDFVMFEFEITNVGRAPLMDFYAGFWCKEVTWSLFPIPDGEDLTGFLDLWSFANGCDSAHTLNLAYLMDNDGDPSSGTFTPRSRRGAVGVMLLGSSADRLEVGYNWIAWDPGYAQDWGPRRRPTSEEPWRSFNPFYAWPGNDRNLYYMMSHPLVAYDQVYAATHQEGWMPPGRLASCTILSVHLISV